MCIRDSFSTIPFVNVLFGTIRRDLLLSKSKGLLTNISASLVASKKPVSFFSETFCTVQLVKLSVVTVSYTHLDVYKRQILERIEHKYFVYYAV